MVKHMLPSTIFFFIGFNLILWTMQLALARHGVNVSGFITATVAALMVGKAVLVTDKLPFMTRFDNAPLIQPILFKASIYWLCAFLVRLLDILVHYLIEHHSLSGFVSFLIDSFEWRRFTIIQIWLMVLFLFYVVIHEINKLFGDGELYRLFFRWRTTEAKLGRRRRIRLLTRLNQLTKAHTIDEISEQGSPAHTELVAILQELGQPNVASEQPTAD